MDEPSPEQVLAHCAASRAAGRCSPPWRPYTTPHLDHRFCVPFAPSAPCWRPYGPHLRGHYLALRAGMAPEHFDLAEAERTDAVNR